MPARTGLHVANLRTALKGPFGMDVPPGVCAVVTGPSGVGKSLFLRMIADLDPNSGTVSLDGQDRDALSAPEWRRRVTYLAAEPGWWADGLAAHMADVAFARTLMPSLGLDPGLLAAPVARLSTGERQRAALVRALAGRPRFLLLDEPTSALDAGSRGLVEAALATVKAGGVGLLVVSHDADQAARIADLRFVMSDTGLTGA